MMTRFFPVWRRFAVAAAGMALSALPVQAQTPGTAEKPDLEKAKAYITESEGKWVDSIVSGRPEDLNRILADDFLGVDPEGNLYDKPTMLGEIVEAPKYYSANKLNAVKVRFFNDTMAVAQGDETFDRNLGQPQRGRFVFTDTWLFRNGTWQVVATESVTVLEPKK